MRITLLTILFFCCAVNVAISQGSTTSSIRGQVSEDGQGPLPGANITAVHLPSGTFYGASTDLEGFYRIDNMKVGGPYKLTYSFVGLEDTEVTNVTLLLGEPFVKDIVLGSSAIQLDEVVVTARAGSAGKNSGASTQIGTEDIEVMPTLNRNLTDYLRLTPQSSGNSFAGTNNRFNAIYVDGAVNNDVFGLAGSGTNGGQTGIAPFSIDIIDQVQVVLSPYDVTFGGFAGGGISAVTKSGTNRLQGTAYYFLQNQNIVGTDNRDLADRLELAQRTRVDEFTKKTYGASLGGPIVKDKVFFFANVELQDDVTPAPFDFGLYEQDGRVTQADLNNLRSVLMSQYGYDPGTFGNTSDELTGTKIFGKLDFNLSNAHKLTLRHNYTKAENFDREVGSSSRINFSNNGEYFPSTTHSSALELNSRFGNKASNKLIIGYTDVFDDRGSLGDDFPFVVIDDANRGSIRFGTEEFSTGNVLEQKILTITDNLKLYRGKHTWTIGTHNEFYDIRNVFIRQNFGSYDFGSLDEFLNGAPADDYDRSYSLIAGDENVIGDESQAAAEFKAMQLGFYIQDEIEMSNRFKLTAGIRLDIPIVSSDPAVHSSFATSTVPAIRQQYPIIDNVNLGSAPDGQIMFSPRVGFEYDMNGQSTSTLRGGLGVFTSRIPFVWPGAMFNNNGLTIGSVDERDIDGDIFFNPDPTTQLTDPNFAVPSGQVDLFVSDFKYPQVLRGNLAWDRVLKGGWNLSFEGIYTKTLNNVLYTNVNSDNTVDFNWTGSPDNRPVYIREDLDPTYSAIYVGSNTSEGYTYSLTGQVAKSWASGLNASLAYTYGDARAINEGSSFQNSSQWRGQIHIDGRNNPLYGRSDYSLGSRILGTISYRLDWNQSGTSATTISLIYDGMSGQAMSYVYGRSAGDSRNINQETGSTSRNRSLVFVPSSSSEINLIDYTSRGAVVSAAEQWANLDAFIESDGHLSSRRGQYSEKNGSREPFTSFVDLSIRQDLGTNIGGSGHKLQFSVDIFNFANLLNGAWGTRYTGPDDFNNYELLNFEGYAEDGTTPQFTYRETKTGTDAFDIQDLNSRWRMRFGVRYIFD